MVVVWFIMGRRGRRRFFIAILIFLVRFGVMLRVFRSGLRREGTSMSVVMLMAMSVTKMMMTMGMSVWISQC